MEFKFNINSLFENTITKLDGQSLICRRIGSNFGNDLSTVVDAIGKASAKAQGLDGVITNASRMRNCDHHLYIMKDAAANNGLGSVVGLLKVGHKNLFLYDGHGILHETSPLCVLDFYVHESRQRKGCGKKIFEYMLMIERIKADVLAIDRPSPKCLAFLMKHYYLKAPIPQVNKFVVFEGFFHNSSVGNKSDSAKPRTPMYPYSRQSSHIVSGDGRCKQPPVESASLGSKNTAANELLNQIMIKTDSSLTEGFHELQANLKENGINRPDGSGATRLAQQTRYSRHMVVTPDRTPLPTDCTQVDMHITTNFPREMTPPILRKRSGHARSKLQQTIIQNNVDAEQSTGNNSLPQRLQNSGVYKPPQDGTNWDPFGASQPIGRYAAASRKYNNTRLW